jgi:hypothetical protein
MVESGKLNSIDHLKELTMKVTDRILETASVLVFALLTAPASFGAQNKNTTKQAQKPAINSSNQTAPQKAPAAAPQPVQQTPPRATPGGPTGPAPQAPVRPPQPGTGRSGDNAPAVNAGSSAGKIGGIAGGGESKPSVGIAGGKKEDQTGKKDDEARKKAKDDEARKKAKDDEARKKAKDDEARKKAKDDEARKKAEDEARRKADERAGHGAVYKERPGEIKTPEPGGFAHRDPKTNTTVHTDASGRITKIERPGTVATGFRSDGRAAHIEHTRADGSRMTVERTARGERRVENVRGGLRVVAEGRRGFVERTVRPGYISRTYVVGGRTYVCRSYAYGEIRYYRYVAPFYYKPAFYEWAYRPWSVPAVYAWGWGPAPAWYYGRYFAPAPDYADPSLWLTDYLLAENLKLAYEDRQVAMESPTQPPAASTLDAATKQMIAAEVQQQIQAAQTVAQQEEVTPGSSNPPADAPPPALDPNQRTFVVSTSLDVTTVKGDGCSLTGGDILFRSGDLQGDKVQVTVLNSKSGDCKANSVTAVEVATLQDMQNQFREQITGGMATLASNEGKKGLPVGPAAGPIPVPDGQPALNAQSLLSDLNREADQTEAEIKQAANAGT